MTFDLSITPAFPRVSPNKVLSDDLYTLRFQIRIRPEACRDLICAAVNLALISLWEKIDFRALPLNGIVDLQLN